MIRRALRPVVVWALACALAAPFLALPGVPPAHAQGRESAAEREAVHFIRNTHRSVLRREPSTADFDRWMKFLAAGGEKSQMVRELRETDEYLAANRPAGICARLSVTVYGRPEPNALRAGTLLPGDPFRVSGREGDYYRIVGPVSGYVERDAIDIIHATQKIGESEGVKPAQALAEYEKLYADLTVARDRMLDALVMDGRATLYRMKPGRSVDGEKARERYQELLSRFVVAAKVQASDHPLEMRLALLDLRDADLYRYEMAGRLDRALRMGVNGLILRRFDRGMTPAEIDGYPRSVAAPWKALEERFAEEAARRSLPVFGYTSGFDFGPPFARREPERTAVNGLGFTSDRYQPGSGFADPALPENRAHMVELAVAAAPEGSGRLVVVSGLFPPVTPELSRDPRALFAFNRLAVRAFENDTGMRLARIAPAQEKVLLGWLRAALRDAYAALRKALDARGAKLAVVVPEHALKAGDLTVVTYRDCPADYYVIPPDAVERFGFAVPGRVLVRYDRAATQAGVEKIDAACRAFRERHPRVVGWIIEP